MGRRHQLRGIVAENQKLSERDRRTLKRIVSKNHRTAAAKVTTELTIRLKTLFSQIESPARALQIQQPRYSCNCESFDY